MLYEARLLSLVNIYKLYSRPSILPPASHCQQGPVTVEERILSSQIFLSCNHVNIFQSQEFPSSNNTKLLDKTDDMNRPNGKKMYVDNSNLQLLNFYFFTFFCIFVHLQFSYFIFLLVLLSSIHDNPPVMTIFFVQNICHYLRDRDRDMTTRKYKM